jgi:hypothetical protein
VADEFQVFQTLFKPQDDRGGKITPISITTTALPDATVGTPYQQTLQASGGAAPVQWSVTPSLPDPLALDKVTGIISGTPTAAAYSVLTECGAVLASHKHCHPAEATEPADHMEKLLCHEY